MLTHGWPGSFVEFLEAIGPLTDPGAHGADPADAFHVVVPSLPGYGFSAKPTEPGWGIRRTARAWAELMAHLGYGRYGAKGGDWGSAITLALGQQDAEHVMGLHVNLLRVFAPRGAELTAEEQVAVEAAAHYDTHESGYLHIQSTRPQTLGYGLVDSPRVSAPGSSRSSGRGPIPEGIPSPCWVPIGSSTTS